MITKERIAELRALGEKATPGPWEVEEESYGDEWWFGGRDCYQHVIVTKTRNVMGYGGEGKDGPHKYDTAFAAAARNAWDELLDEIERLQGDRYKLREALADMIMQYGGDETCMSANEYAVEVLDEIKP